MMLPKFNFSSYRIKHWFPGHMLKASREIKEKLKLVDCVIILLDARTPLSSYNPELEKTLAGKATVVLLNKIDLADERTTDQWLSYYQTEERNVLTVNLKNGQGIKKILPTVQKAIDEKRKKDGAKHPLYRPMRAMILGLPNVGKSTLINKLSRKNKAKAGPKPGVTRHQQWVSLSENMELLDTPGIMMPKGNDKETELKLALGKIMRQSICGEEILAEYLLFQLWENNLLERLSFYQENFQPQNIQELLEVISQKRGAVLKKGEIDTYQAALYLLADFAEGKLGRLSFEKPNQSELARIQIKW